MSIFHLANEAKLNELNTKNLKWCGIKLDKSELELSVNQDYWCDCCPNNLGSVALFIFSLHNEKNKCSCSQCETTGGHLALMCTFCAQTQIFDVNSQILAVVEFEKHDGHLTINLTKETHNGNKMMRITMLFGSISFEDNLWKIIDEEKKTIKEIK